MPLDNVHHHKPILQKSMQMCLSQSTSAIPWDVLLTTNSALLTIHCNVSVQMSVSMVSCRACGKLFPTASYMYFGYILGTVNNTLHCVSSDECINGKLQSMWKAFPCCLLYRFWLYSRYCQQYTAMFPCRWVYQWWVTEHVDSISLLHLICILVIFQVLSTIHCNASV